MRHISRNLRTLVILVTLPIGATIYACGGGGGDGGGTQTGATSVIPAVTPPIRRLHPPVGAGALSGKYAVQSWLEQEGDQFTVFGKVFFNGSWAAPQQIGSSTNGGTSIEPNMQVATDPNGYCVQVQIERSAAGSTILAFSNRPSDRTWLGPQVIGSTALEAFALTLALESAKDLNGSVLYCVATVGWSEKTDAGGTMEFTQKTAHFRTDTLGSINSANVVTIIPTLSSLTQSTVGSQSFWNGSKISKIY